VGGWWPGGLAYSHMAGLRPCRLMGNGLRVCGVAPGRLLVKWPGSRGLVGLLAKAWQSSDLAGLLCRCLSGWWPGGPACSGLLGLPCGGLVGSSLAVLSVNCGLEKPSTG
jgi:hypothetical protein